MKFIAVVLIRDDDDDYDHDDYAQAQHMVNEIEMQQKVCSPTLHSFPRKESLKEHAMPHAISSYTFSRLLLLMVVVLFDRPSLYLVDYCLTCVVSGSSFEIVSSQNFINFI